MIIFIYSLLFTLIKLASTFPFFDLFFIKFIGWAINWTYSSGWFNSIDSIIFFKTITIAFLRFLSNLADVSK